MPENKLIPVSREVLLERNLAQITSNAQASGGPRLLLNYLRILSARRWTVLSIVAITVVGTLFWTLRQVPVYRASTTIQIDRESSNILNFKDAFQVDINTDDTLRTQFEILKSAALATAVIDDLHLQNSPDYQPKPESLFRKWIGSLTLRNASSSPAKDQAKGAPTNAADGLLDAYAASLQVVPVRQSRLATVSFDATDPELAARIVNAHAEHFIEQNFRFKWEATQQASDFLSLQLKTLKANLENAEDSLQAYSREHEILFTEEGKNTATEKLKQLEQEYTTAQEDRLRKESYVRLARGGSIDSLPQLNNPLIGTLTAKLADLRREDSELSVTFAPDYPGRQRIQRQIHDVEASIANEKTQVSRNIQTEYAAAVEHERLLSEALAEHRTVVNKTNQEVIQYNILKREADSNKQLYDGLLTRLKEAGVSAGLRASNIRVVDKAKVPRRPVRPDKLYNLMLGLIVGLSLGMCAAFLREYLDDSIRSADDITERFGLPVLGLIPKFDSMSKKRYGYSYGKAAPALESGATFRLETATHTSPGSAIAEAYRSFRTSLLLSTADHSPKAVLITSAAPSEGKTATSANCAISLTQTGARVVLVDADMRRPRLHEIFGIENKVGLSGLLTGSCTLKDAIQQSAIPNLYIIPSGVIPPNPVELILSERFSRMMDALRKYFDHVIIDSPPVSNVSDPRVLAQSCDGVLLVIKGLSTSRHQIRRALEHLSESQTPVIGVVLNDIDKRGRTSLYPYYYSSDYYQKSDGNAQSA